MIKNVMIPAMIPITSGPGMLDLSLELSVWSAVEGPEVISSYIAYYAGVLLYTYSMYVLL